MLETVLFYVFSAAVLLSAIGVILSRSAVYSVLSLVSAMCFLAGLFVLLKAFLVATILVLVYAGAILVLFLFVVMHVEDKDRPETGRRSPLGLASALAVAGAFAYAGLRAAHSLPAWAERAVDGGPREIGRLLFVQYALPFELTSFLLLAAVVSVVVLAKRAPRA